MRKFRLIIFGFLCFSCFIFNINAACDDTDLSEWVQDVTINYMEDVDIIDENGNTIWNKEYLYLLYTSSYNPFIKVMVSDTHNVKPYEVKYDQKFGSFVLGSYVHMNEKKYTFTFYGTSDSACPNTVLRTITYTVPPYNVYSVNNFCLNNPEEDICRTNDSKMNGVSDRDFVKRVDDIEEDNRVKNMNFIEKVWYYITKNWYFIVAPIILVSAFYAVKIYLYKKKVDKEL